MFTAKGTPRSGKALFFRHAAAEIAARHWKFPCRRKEILL
jgi:hypothetical protein